MFVNSCPECALVSGGGKILRIPMCPISPETFSDNRNRYEPADEIRREPICVGPLKLSD